MIDLKLKNNILSNLNRAHRFVKVFVFFLFAMPLSAQYVDSNYIQARELAYKGQFDTAITLLKVAIDDNPHDIEMLMTLARVYAWNKNYKEAEAQTQEILTKQSKNREALAILADVHLWSKNWSALENLTQQALTPQAPSEALVKDSVVFIQKLVFGLIEQTRYEDARDALLPVRTQLPKLWDIVRIKLMTNALSVRYNFYNFQNQNTDWHTLELEYIKRLHGLTVVGGVNLADRFGARGSQYMLQAYPKLGKKMYAWLIAGFSDGKAFPNGTYGISLFRSVKRYWEPELGIRLFTVTKNNEKATVLRGGISYHKRLNRFNYLLNYIDGTGSNGWAHNLSYRRYLKDDESYLQLGVGTGASSQGIISPQFDSFIINSFTASLSGVYWFNKNWRGGIGIALEQSQKSIGVEVPKSRLIYSLGLTYRF
jgi:YaiO family outer membrane protein